MSLRPPTSVATIAALAIAVIAISSSAPLIAYAAAPALAIAFWRNAIATGTLAPIASLTRRTELRQASWRIWARSALAGIALAGHFATWIPSAKLTSVAAATALVATQPVWQGVIAFAQGNRPNRLMWTGIALAVAGAALATGIDVLGSGRALAGDVLALAGGLLVAGYVSLGEGARAHLSTIGYTTICYGVCALVLLAICLIGGVRLHSYPLGTWLAIVGLAAGAQLLGHSMFNYALRRVRATTVSVLTLLEVPGAALLGWVWLHQVPRPGQLAGIAVLLAGVVVVTRASQQRAPTSPVGPAPDQPTDTKVASMSE